MTTDQLSRTPAAALPGSSRTRRSRAWAALGVLLVLQGCSKPVDHLARGREQLAAGHYSAAVIEMKNAVQAQPKSVDARLALADAQERANDGSGAEQQLRQALANGGAADTIVPRIAMLMLERNDADKIVHEFKDRKLGSADANGTLRAIVALAFVSQRRISDARAQLEGAADTPAVTIARAQLLLVDGKREEALAMLAKAKETPDTPWWVPRAASRVAGASGDMNASLTWMRRAHEAAPWHRAIVGEYGEALIFAGKLDEAATVRDKLKRMASRYFWTQYLDASLQARAGRLEESHAAALRVLSVVPDHLPAGLLAASAELESNDVERAEKRLRTLAQKHPGSLPLLRLLAQAQLRLGQPLLAGATVKRGLAAAPDNAELLSLGAEIDLMKGDRKRAVATMAALVAKRPDDSAAVLRLAEMKTALGERAEAQRLFELVAAKEAKDSSVIDRTVAGMLRLRNVQRAREVADKGVAARPADPQAKLTLAAVQAAQGDNAAAWSTTLAALDAAPAHTASLSALRPLAKKPEQRKELLARYARAADTKGAESAMFLQYAKLLRAEGQPDSAVLSSLEKGLAAVPASERLRSALVEDYFAAGQADKALSTAQGGASMADASAEAQALLASAYERTGKAAQAIDIYGKLAAANPLRTDWRTHLAALQATNGRPADAAVTLRRLIADRPDDAEPYAALAALSVKANPDEALSIVRQMGAREPLAGAAAILQGDVLIQAGRFDDALVAFKTAEKKAIGGPVPLMRTVDILDKQNRRTAADQAMSDLLRRFPEDAAALSFSSQRLLAQTPPQAPRAVQLMKKAVARAPNNAVLLNELAWAQLQAADPEALETARKAVVLLPNHPNTLDTLGLALARAGRRDDALATLRKAVNLAPLALAPRLHYVEQLVGAGNRQAAAAALQPLLSAPLKGADLELRDKLKAAVAA